MADGLNWGFIGTGWISQRLADAVRQVPGANIWSVASRSAERAAEFAEKFGAQKQYTSNEEFANDPDLDVAVIGTPHPKHHAETILCLNAGKHVLCEKPMAMNLRQVDEMIAAAQANKRFLMEAMWTWFIPATLKARELIEAGEIGEPRLLNMLFSARQPFDPTTRFYDPELGGGSLLDQGIYPLAVALYLFGKPDTIVTQAVIGETGVDEQSSTVMKYADGRIAAFTIGLQAQSPCDATVGGTTAYMRIHGQFWHAERLTIGDRQGRNDVYDLPFNGSGYRYEIEEVMRCIEAGKLESDVVSWQVSRDLAGMMDDLRAQWGVRYPGE